MVELTGDAVQRISLHIIVASSDNSYIRSVYIKDDSIGSLNKLTFLNLFFTFRLTNNYISLIIIIANDIVSKCVCQIIYMPLYKALLYKMSKDWTIIDSSAF